MRLGVALGLGLALDLALSVVHAAPDQTASAVSQAESSPDPDAAIAQLEASVPAPKPGDVRSIGAIMIAIYDVISGPAGDRDWNRFRSLMLPQARLTESSVDEKGKHVVQLWSVDEFIAATKPVLATNPFYEHAIVNRVERFGNVAQVFTSYASRSEPSGTPFQRGINSMQLMYDGKRWWVLSILWDIDRPGNALPKAMGGG
jgi:hypothetical protein